METYLEPNMNIRGIPDVFAENSLKKDDSFPYYGLWIFSGQQRSGKTLLMMHLVKMMHDEYPDAVILSNISIFGIPCIPYTCIEDIEKYANGRKGLIVVIDEIHTLFNSLESKNMPLSTMQVWCQNGKNRRVILGTSQRFNRVAKGIREQTTWNYECHRPILKLIYSYICYDGAEYDDEGNYNGEAPKRSFYVPNVNVMRMYNTLEIVKRDSFEHQIQKKNRQNLERGVKI